MSQWQFDSEALKIRSLVNPNWEIDLRKVNCETDLLYWLLQAAQKEWDMKELFEKFNDAVDFCFNQRHLQGAAALKEIFNVFPIESGSVNWENGTSAKYQR
ncbi:hypothetical protein [Parazoarcus communis]|uniref:hypothetical protein n=1 Tax=Parazoarcus communis TaxID=41977 RepID=UPI00131EFD75|nr:hypothetical protein [Parazoarcus communis]